MTIVDLALYASSICRYCRADGRPHDDSDQEHGDQFVHLRWGPGSSSAPCEADQIWGLIRRMEYLTATDRKAGQ